MKKTYPLLFLLLVFCLILSACGLLAAEEETSRPAGETAQASAAADSLPAAPGTSPVVFKIVPGDAAASFEIDEDLLSSLTGWGFPTRFTVIGTTDQVTGQLSLDPAAPNGAQVGEIRIDARTLKTNDYFRNRAIHTQILNTEEYAFISFVPQQIRGLPADVQVGESVSFSIEGGLTIRDVTLTETFSVTSTLVSDAQINGIASAVIERTAYGLTIPSVPNVSNVEETVELTIDFIARTP